MSEHQLTTGLNAYWLLNLLENLSNLSIGPDADTDDITQDLVLQFLKEGFQTIVAADPVWPWFQTTYGLNTIPGTGDYISGFTRETTSSPVVQQGVPVSFSDIAQITNIVNSTNSGNSLIYIAQDKAQATWIGATDQTNIPAYWSLWAGYLYLWPRPQATYFMRINGYRKPSLTWLTVPDNAESEDYVDLPNELQLALVNWTMMRIYQFQEDPEMSKVYSQHFAASLANYQDNLTSPNANQPLVLSGGLQLNKLSWWGNPGFGVYTGSPYPFAQAW